MKKIIEGHLIGTGLKVAVVVARFNEFITGKLLTGAYDGLKRHGVLEENMYGCLGTRCIRNSFNGSKSGTTRKI